MNSENVFKVCDEPHPILIRDMIEKCLKNDFDQAYQIMNHLWRLGSFPSSNSFVFQNEKKFLFVGYTAEDILSVIMRVTKTYPMTEFIQLEFIRVTIIPFSKLFLIESLVDLGDRFNVHARQSRCGISITIIIVTRSIMPTSASHQPLNTIET